jgi:hypothetical protein
MGCLSKSLAFVLVTLLFLTSSVTLPHALVKAYDNNSGDISCKLKVENPNGNTAYSGIMPLNFTVDWNVSRYVFWVALHFSYAIDGNAKNSTNGGGTLHFDNDLAVVTTSTNDIVDISNLTSGLHRLTIFAEGRYDLNNDYVFSFNDSFSPVIFYVNILPPPSTLPATVVTLLIVVFLAVAVIFVLFYRRRKHG